MDPLKELPLGFGMALVQNETARRRFSAMTRAEQQMIIDRTHAIASKEEMKAFVSGIAAEQNMNG